LSNYLPWFRHSKRTAPPWIEAWFEMNWEFERRMFSRSRRAKAPPLVPVQLSKVELKKLKLFVVALFLQVSERVKAPAVAVVTSLVLTRLRKMLSFTFKVLMF